MKKLVIAEKPSVAQTIAKVLRANKKGKGFIENDEYIVSWCIGHLVGLAEADSYGDEYKKWDKLPVIPSHWNYAVKTSTGEQFSILKKLMNDTEVSEVICATDAGREGELIFRHVYNMADCTKKIKRLWISSMEDKAVKEGFDNLKDGHNYDNLFYSALCRERADWLVGINFTRFFTSLYNSSSVLSIGRVQTPTLAMIAERDNKISGFVKEKFYTVDLNCGSFKAVSEKISDLTLAEKIKNNCKNTAVIKSVKTEEKSVKPPKLYDLTSLQREANRLFGFTAQQTLELVQKLYENKLATYPRTDSQYITDDMKNTVENIAKMTVEKINFLSGNENFNVDAVINNKKVSDHHAILPTEKAVQTNLSALPDSEQRIIYMLFARLIEAVGEKHIYDYCKAEILNNDTVFTASGKTITKIGWKDTETKFKAFLSCKEEKNEETSLPKLCEKMEINCTADIAQHYTSPPKPYTEDTLLSAMERAGNEDYDNDDVERKGLGTPATRAGIIETLILRGYAERKGKQIISTQKGRRLIEVAPVNLKSAKMTAEWENKLVLVGKGEFDKTVFMNDIAAFVEDIVKNTAVISEMAAVFNEREIIGKCPRCGGDVIEGKLNFYCINNDCSFALWKKNKFFETKKKELTKTVAKTLLKDGKVFVKGLYSEAKNKKYDANIILDDTGDKYVNFKLEFPKK